MKKVNVALLQDLSQNNGRGTQLRVASDQGSAHRSLSPALIHVLEEVQRELGYNQAGNSDILTGTEVEELIATVADRLGLELTRLERDEVLTEIERDQKPFGIIQELVDDPQISDIIVTNYSKIAVQQGRRNFTTGLAFPSQAAYEAFVERLLQRGSASYSTKKPIADGMIGGFARLHAVHPSICESGPYLTIRLNRFSSVSAGDLVQSGMAPREIFDYLESLIRCGQTILIVGEVGAGKTTLARSLASAVPQEDSILVIEDTPEIRLEHPQVRYITTREANIEGTGRIAPSECIRAGMRMAMNRIVFGEIRDAEAAEAFIDVCASGHPGLSTIHARSGSEAMTRLELFLGRAQRGVTRAVLSEQIATAVQAIVFVNICHDTGRRRIMEVKEIGPVADGVVRERDIFRYQVHKGVPGWKVVNRISAHREKLEAGEPPLVISSFPPVLELSTAAMLKEAASRR